MIKIAHISDVHFRSLKRHEEYKTVFKKLFSSLKENNVDLIFIGGDIVHSKTQGITPEIIDLLSWWFTSLASIAPTHVILGNHDGLILNKDRQDAITPIINALNNPNIFLYKESGIYPAGIGNINWCVFSCFDEENWDKVAPSQEGINIACFHGAVWGSKTDVDWELDGEVSLSFFDGYDFSFLGDIHKLQYLDKEKRVAYPGSTIQQNYGEDIKKGYLLWEINNRNDYKSKFLSIDNPFPFVTIDWQDSLEDTLRFCEKVKSGSRFRIRNKTSISQIEIKMLHHYLKNDKKACEVVFQNLGKQDLVLNTLESIEEKSSLDIRIKSDRKLILKNFYTEIDKITLENLDNLFAENLDKLPNDLSDKIANKWSIDTLEFNNTFSYGKNNKIDFNNLSGIIGLFGNNRAGKSSIPGTLMYSLFNTTDRGSLKNIDIVNTRKGFCDAKIIFSVNGNKYELFRKTEKKTSKKGITSASTNLTLNHIDSNSVNDQTEEQRRETEKIVRKLIGTPEDFLATSFASQGEINSFIKEKSSARKSILSKFLNIELYEELYKLSREEYIVLKNKIKEIKEVNWDLEIQNLQENIVLLKEDILSYKDKLSKTREKEVSLKIEQNLILKSNEDNSGYTLNSVNDELTYLENKIKQKKNSNSILNLEISDDDEKILKINAFKNSYSIKDLQEEKHKLDNFINKLSNFNTKKSVLKSDINRHENEIKILDQVPCDNKFKDCKFIKNAYESKNQIEEVSDSLKDIEISILEIKNVINKLKEKEIDDKIEKYNNILVKEQKIKSEIINKKTKIDHNNDQLNNLIDKKTNLENIKNQIQDKNSDESIQKNKEINEKLEKLSEESNKIDRLINECSQNIFSNNSKITLLSKEKEDFIKINEKWKLYDLYSFSVSKKGIPTSIINSTLPKINLEIEKILCNVVNFKIILEENSSNNLDVFIDYGDSKRIIECASGMEKMIASIAIRVALINISNLPKSDIFIIDEGFGALDSNNIESCARLLTSLKRYFKTILIISHVDAIKDIVDKNIEISLKNKDSYVNT